MGAIGFQAGELVVEREPNDLDVRAMGVTDVLEDLGIRQVSVAETSAILAGRERRNVS